MELARRSCYYRLESSDNPGTLNLRDNQDRSTQIYKVIKKFDFSPERKRMSVVVKDTQGVFHVFIKGADEVVEPLLTKIDEFDKLTLDYMD